MEIKIGNIVKSKSTDEVFEVMGIIGDMIICNRVNEDSTLASKGLPFLEDELEIIMDESTETFDLLFRNEDENT